MHDTPAKSLFARARRDFSHGCIRLEKATDLAEWVLRQESGWPRERIEAAMQGTETFSVKLKHAIPVATVYVTAVVLENGEVRFFEDLYGQDAILEKELDSASAEAQATSAEPAPRPRE
jgi:murein L,D-transpeptidase YcbB/YkuD